MSNEESCCSNNKLGLIYGALLLRLWLGVRAIQTGIEKFSGTKMVSGTAVEIDGKANDYGLETAASIKYYAMGNYHGVPAGLYKQFEGEPLMMGWALNIYDKVLGPILLILGLTILLGIASRTSLFLLGLLYVSLTWGLILIGQDPGVAWLGTHMVLIAMALMLAEHNRFAILKKW
ncbi:MAG: hypothetical protein ACQCXQ_02915 [Verrucomicrobiales bacterium]|nr:hypothetical protein [Verrucomicrobiota bacterium JB025]